ncbi:MazG-like family protein [Paenibacillus physcomitrellae]|uniref:NTP pyrophosphohydrolase MazG putative catalytic core domain-containing protein n=1 Tax=Paenibacillus physcomitrellae TaxID=1619311 RepID=A0ABQ1GM21_9BACL|nr:MazG-like family protein [Paenibacillus physcomitrellae]GGA46550.1 hypothetical protein GCM10010917_34820 [Paenibacillus physcomitrellae]
MEKLEQTPQLEQLFNEIKQLSRKEPKTLEQMALKLSEEAGETSQAVLSALNASGSGYKQLGLEDVKEECVDVILVALAMFHKLSDQDGELTRLLGEKMSKWAAKMGSA